MGADMLVAICSLIGTAIGTIGGILASNKLVSFRLQQLEKKVDKHNCFDGRLVKVEERSKSNTHRLNRIDEIEDND